MSDPVPSGGNDKLQSTSADWERVFNSIPDLVMILDMDHKILVANPATCKAVNLPQHEITGKFCYEIFHCSDHPPEECPFEKLKISNNPQTIDMELEALNGTYMVTVAPIFDEHSKVIKAVHIAKDITDHKEAAKALKESEILFRSLYESAQAFIHIIDTHGRIIDTNPYSIKKSGYSRDELVGSTLSDYFTPTSQLIFAEQFQILLAKGHNRTNVEFICNGQKTISVECTGSVVYDNTGAIKYIVVFQQDVTERVQAMQELRRKNRALKALSEANQLLIRAKDEKSYLHSTCKVLVDIGGYRLAWIGFAEDDDKKTVRPIAQKGFEEGYLDTINISWEDNERGRGPTGTVIRTGKPAICKNVVTDPDYEPWRDEAIKRGYASSIALPLITDNRPFGALNVYASEPDVFDEEEVCLLQELADDVAYGIVALRTAAKHKQAEKEVLQREEQYRLLVETIPYGIQENDLTGIITFSNAAHHRIMGYEPGELIGKPIWHAVITQEKKEELKNYLAVLVKKQPVPTSFTGQNRTKDGKIIDVQIDWNYKRDERGNLTGFISVITDITDKKNMEEQLRQSQKLEAIGTLAGGIAHDFNNILSPIFGFTELARGALPEESELREYLGEVLTASHRAKELVKQILAFSRKGDQEKHPMLMQPILKEALKLLRASLPTTIEIHQKIDADCGPIFADPTQIHQVIMNLCTNAFHAMQEHGGALEVTLSDEGLYRSDYFSPISLPSGKYVRLTVSDTGHGMDQDIVKRIFEPYFTTKEMGEGTGLGLSVAHGIVMHHGGQITVQSRPGKGTKFEVYFPQIETKSYEAVEKNNIALPGGSERILLVDDEDLVLKASSRMLERLGYTVTTFGNSGEALEFFQQKPNAFDIVITDLTMPGMKGSDLAKKFMETRPDIPIILCSGYKTQEPEAYVQELGIKKFLMKPLNRLELAETVRKILDEYIDTGLPQ